MAFESQENSLRCWFFNIDCLDYLHIKLFDFRLSKMFHVIILEITNLLTLEWCPEMKEWTKEWAERLVRSLEEVRDH